MPTLNTDLTSECPAGPCSLGVIVSAHGARIDALERLQSAQEMTLQRIEVRIERSAVKDDVTRLEQKIERAAAKDDVTRLEEKLDKAAIKDDLIRMEAGQKAEVQCVNSNLVRMEKDQKTDLKVVSEQLYSLRTWIIGALFTSLLAVIGILFTFLKR